jgi:plastocyanin
MMRLPLFALLSLALALAGCSEDGGGADDDADLGPEDDGGDASGTTSASQSTTSAAPAAPAGPARTHEVVMRSNLFEPADLTLRVGDTIHWTTEDVQPHNVVSESEAGAFRSEDVSVIPVAYAQEYSYTFTAPGTVDYLCEYHPGMVGTVIVEA